MRIGSNRMGDCSTIVYCCSIIEEETVMKRRLKEKKVPTLSLKKTCIKSYQDGFLTHCKTENITNKKFKYTARRNRYKLNKNRGELSMEGMVNEHTLE